MTTTLVEWGVASAPLAGCRTSGDLCMVKESPEGILMTVVDGLGHGEEASAAAKKATDIVEAHFADGITALIQRCHEGLRDTRGAVMSVAWLGAKEASLTWAGVGNVEGLLVRGNRDADPTSESLLLRPGVVGDRLPALYVTRLPLTKGDIIIMATDGVRADFGARVKTDGKPQQIAERILSQCAKGTDDALVLVARYSGTDR